MNPALPTPIAPAMTDALFALTLALLLLAPLAIAGVALINTGLGRSRSAAQSLLGNLAIVAVTAIVFAVVGAAWAGYGGAGEPHLSVGRQALELAGSGAAAAGRLWLGARHRRNWRCSLSFWPWRWRL